MRPSNARSSTRGKSAGSSVGTLACISAGKRQAGGAAEQPEQQVLDQRLTHEPRAPGAERRSDRELAAPCGRARELQAGGVGGGRDQQQHHRGQQNQDRGTHFARQRLQHRDG